MRKFVIVCTVIIFLVGIWVAPTLVLEQQDETIVEAEVEVAEEIFFHIIEEPIILEEEIYSAVVTNLHNEEDVQFLWDELSKYSPSDVITAGVMGYFWRESRFRSNAVAGWDVRNIGRDRDICEEFTEIVDAGLADGSSYEYFYEMITIYYGGYGLGQWLSHDYLEHFYDFIQKHEGSIGDATLQCEFVFESIQLNQELWQMLLECETAAQAGRRIGIYYDGATQEGVEYIAASADQFYKKFAN